MIQTHNSSNVIDPPSGFDPQEAILTTCLEKISARNENALADFYDVTVNRVYGLAFRITHSPQIAEEVVSDVYFQVWQQAERYDAARGKVFSWLLTVCRSRALDALRRRDQTEICAEPELLISNDYSNDDDPLDLLLTVERHNTVHAALKSLDSKPRQLLALAFFRGLSHQEIADCTGIPLGSVKSMLRHSMLTLKQILHKSTAPVLETQL